MMISRSALVAAALLVSVCAVPPAAGAQTPSYATREETIRGTIVEVRNVNHLFVADDRGYTDDVTLRSGAAILSNGVRLEPGQRVTIHGSAAGPTFVATRIATESRAYASEAAPSTAPAYPAPVPAYYAAPAYYPAPAYYSASLFFGFGPHYRYGRGYRSFYGRYRPYYGYRGGYRPVGVGVRVHIR